MSRNIRKSARDKNKSAFVRTIIILQPDLSLKKRFFLNIIYIINLNIKNEKTVTFVRDAPGYDRDRRC